jgi:integrase
MSYLIGAHLDHLRALGRSPRTITERGTVLRRLHNELPLGIAWAATTELETWFAGLVAAGLSAWTLATYAMHVRGFYRWADGRELVGNPAAELPRPRNPHSLPDPVTDAELRQALDRSDEWWRRAIAFATLAGMRASELALQAAEDVTSTRILIRRAKGGDPQNVPTHPQLAALASAMPPGPLLPTSTGGHLTPRSLSVRARHHFDKIGLPLVHLHRFRHRFGTDLLRQGVDLRVVQELMRHRSIRSTQGYTLVVDAQREAGIRLLPHL